MAQTIANTSIKKDTPKVSGPIVRVDSGLLINRVPFIIGMINEAGILQKMPLGIPGGETVWGIELMINPANLTTNSSKIISRTQTMTSFVEDHWGDELDTITFAGSSAAFVSGGVDINSVRATPAGNSPANDLLQDTGTFNQEAVSGFNAVAGSDVYSTSDVNSANVGLTVIERRNSMSYVHFKRMVDLIRVNGCFYDDRGFVANRYYIYLSYGNAAYKGFFENIDVTEDANNPFRFQYTATFKAEETIYSFTANRSWYNGGPVSTGNTSRVITDSNGLVKVEKSG